MLVSNTRITVPAANRKEFFQTVSKVIDKIRSEAGCISFRFYEEVGDEISLLLISEWEARADWERHETGSNFAIVHGSVQVLSIPSKIGHTLLKVIEE